MSDIVRDKARKTLTMSGIVRADSQKPLTMSFNVRGDTCEPLTIRGWEWPGSPRGAAEAPAHGSPQAGPGTIPASQVAKASTSVTAGAEVPRGLW